VKRPRRNSKGGDKPLLDTGLLAASLSGGGAAGSVDQLTPSTLTFGTGLRAAAASRTPVVHQEGGRHVPRRRFLGVGPDLLAKFGRVLADHVKRLLGGGGPD
jgi:hypothetical protein